MKAKLINEKFTEDSDPIDDIGIGNPIVKQIKKDIQELQNMDLFNPSSFSELRKFFQQLKISIIANSILSYFKDKYGIQFIKSSTYKNDLHVFETEYKGNIFILEITQWAVIYLRKERLLSSGFADDLSQLDKNFKKLCKQNNIKIKKKGGY